ncbi:MAG: sugar-transfer associated ATP-grasp domain-containing protein [Bacillota bacterium]
MPLQRLRQSAERLVYRVAGLPVAVRAAVGSADDPLRSAFAARYWHPESASELAELALALLLWPIGLVAASAWSTALSGAAIRRRHGKGVAAQLDDQLRLYFSDGVLAPWYYIFSLHQDGPARAPTFIQRFETKTCYFRLLKARKGSPLQDKVRFADFCSKHGIRSVETAMSLAGADPARPLPDCDLFVKPKGGRGGRGAERWDRVGPGLFEGPDRDRLGREELLARLVERSRDTPLILQPRMSPHPALAAMTSGALPTLRVLTCLDEHNQPEVIAAMMRTSFGANRTVDNLHAGGIGALVDVASGRLGKASNLGADARLGWFSAHPDTGAPIEGAVVPCWEAAKAQAAAAHRHFADRVVIGWDIAVLEDGPIFVEGNGNPDLDILQRFMWTGLRDHRFGRLLAHHLRHRQAASPSHRKRSQAIQN